MTILITIILTVLSVLILMNFVTAEKKIQHKLEKHYTIQDPQFMRSIVDL